MPSLAEEDEPQQATEKNDHGGIKERDGLDGRLKLSTQKDYAQDGCQNDRNDET
jgi:hypothetical protein